MISADVYRRLGTSGGVSAIKLFCLDRAFRPIVTLRLHHATRHRWYGRLLHPFIWFLHKGLCQLAAIDLPLTTVIGPGLAIVHGWGLVVTQGAVIGRNATLFHGATIGQGDVIGPDGSRTTLYPVVGDDVWIGPNATIVGGVTIGNGSRILAGTVIVADVPPRSLVGGNPGALIRGDCPMDVLNRVEAR